LHILFTDLCSEDDDGDIKVKTECDGALERKKYRETNKRKNREEGLKKLMPKQCQEATELYGRHHQPSTSGTTSRESRKRGKTYEENPKKKIAEEIPDVIRQVIQAHRHVSEATTLHVPKKKAEVPQYRPQYRKFSPSKNIPRQRSPSPNIPRRPKSAITKAEETIFASQRFIIERFIATENLRMSSDDVMLSLSDAFNPGFVTGESRWEILQEKVPAALPSLKRLMKEIDIGGVIGKVEKAINDIPDHQKTHFYVGVVSRAFEDRLYDHLKRHDSLQGKIIAVYKTLDEGLLAEFTAIDFLKEVLDRQVDGPKIAGIWNKSEGFDSPSLITAAKSAEKISVYVLYSERPFEKLIRQVGSLSMKANPEKRIVGKFFSLNASRNIFFANSNIERHMKR
jgi:hypothetical protein